MHEGPHPCACWGRFSLGLSQTLGACIPGALGGPLNGPYVIANCDTYAKNAGAQGVYGAVGAPGRRPHPPRKALLKKLNSKLGFRPA